MAIAPLLAGTLDAPLGEPVADDFWFLRYTYFSPSINWFDGGGLKLYWRPLPRQLYFGLLGPVMVDHPSVVAMVHFVAIGLAVWLTCRALLAVWPARWCVVAASFPFLMESARMLVAWPSHFQDVGMLLFSAMALHEAVRARLWTAMAALMASLLCKETAVVTALLLPWMPAWRSGGPKQRVRWTAAVGAVVGIWGATYWVIWSQVGQLFPRDFALEPDVLATPWSRRYLWALAHSAVDAFSLAELAPPWDVLGAGCVLAIAAAAGGLFIRRSESRARLASSLPWMIWGVTWFLAAPASLADVYPYWASYRSVFGALGLGVAATVLLAAAHPVLPMLLLGARLGTFALSPGAPAAITLAPDERGIAFDFPKLARVQRFVQETRRTLLAQYPTAPPDSWLVPYYLPRMAEYGFAENRAPQVWYRDTTIRWLSMREFVRNPDLPVLTLIEYQRESKPQVALVDVEAMRHLLAAVAHVERGGWRPALEELRRAEVLQRGPDAVAFRATLVAKRAACLWGLGDGIGAEQEALRGLEIFRGNADSRRVLALVWAARGRLAEAESQLDTQLRRFPQDEESRTLRERIRQQRAQLKLRPSGGR